MRFYAAWAFVVFPPAWAERGFHNDRFSAKQQFEVSLDYLREFDFEPVTTTDKYFVKYDAPTAFTVRGKTVIVESKQLAAALLRLPEKRREVLFLRYYLGYSDTEIGRLFGVCRSTVFHRRKRALRLLRKEMEALENEQ